MASYSVTISIEIDRDDFYFEGEVEVTADYIPYERGARGCCGEPLEPDHPDGFDLYHIKAVDSDQVFEESDLGEYDIDRAIEALFAQLEEEYYK